jgi:predicted nucleic acid-binding protein
MSQNILIDSCFWFALFEHRDSEHNNANDIFDVIIDFNKIIPWPTLYEVINTRFVRKRYVDEFDRILKEPKTIKVSDLAYRENGLLLYNSAALKYKNYSLVDIIIRNMIEDVNLKIDVLVTFNRSDFEDICYRKSIEILDA